MNFRRTAGRMPTGALAILASAIAVFIIGCPPQHIEVRDKPGPSARAPIEFGPLTLEISYDRRASLFHAVDQMSAWYPSHHVAFEALKKSPPLTNAETRALEEQRAIRALHPWGSGLDPAYYLGQTDAVNASTRAKEDRVLERMDRRLDNYLINTQPYVEHFAGTMRTMLPQYAPTFAAVGELAGTPKRTLFVALVARPGPGIGGGGANGGVLVVEVTSDESSMTALVHESTHALLEQRRDTIRAAARRCGAGLDAMTLEEGIAHAVAPGLIHDGAPGDDPLAHMVSNDNGAKLEGNVSFRALGLAMRPALSHALDNGDFEGLLNDGCEAWKRLRR